MIAIAALTKALRKLAGGFQPSELPIQQPTPSTPPVGHATPLKGPSPEIETMMLLSLDHLSPGDCNCLDDDFGCYPVIPLVIHSLPDGYLIRVPYDSLEQEQYALLAAQLPSLDRLLIYAARFGVDWVRIDDDGALVTELATYSA